MLGLLIAAVGEHDAGGPGLGTGLPIIIGVLVALVLGAIALHLLIANRAKASKGGVQPPPEETGRRHPAAPPLESVEPRS